MITKNDKSKNNVGTKSNVSFSLILITIKIKLLKVIFYLIKFIAYNLLLKNFKNTIKYL